MIDRTCGSRSSALTPVTRRILLLPLCVDRLFNTDGAGDFVFDVGDVEAQEVGPYIEDVVISAYGKAFSQYFTYKVVGEFSNDGGASWKAFAGSVLPTQSAGGHVNGNPYTTRTDFGLRVRFRIVATNSQGTAKESGTITATACIKIWT